jgi:hypothetical protein
MQIAKKAAAKWCKMAPKSRSRNVARPAFLAGGKA